MHSDKNYKHDTLDWREVILSCTSKHGDLRTFLWKTDEIGQNFINYLQDSLLNAHKFFT